MRRWLVAMLGILLVPLLAHIASSQGYGGISGRITDESGAGIPGAKITAIHQDDYGNMTYYYTTTTSQGDYSFVSVPAGYYSVFASAQGFQTNASYENVLSSGGTLAISLSLERSFVISGYVNGTSFPIAGAAVYAECEVEAFTRNCASMTLADGTYAINTNIAPGRYIVKAWATDYVAQEKYVDIPGDTNATICNFVLVPSCKLNVNVIDESNNMIAGAKVLLINDSGVLHEGTTDASGTYSIGTNLSAGTYAVVARLPGYVTNVTELDMIAGGTKDVTLKLLSSVVLRGYVKRSSGEAIENASVSLVTTGVEDEIVFSTNETGYYEFTSDLRPGDYLIAYTHPAFHNTSFAMTLSAGIMWCNVTMTRYSYISGYVVDATGNAVHGAIVTAYEDGGHEDGCYVDGFGYYAFRVEQLSGGISLTASAPGYLTSTRTISTPIERTEEENFTLSALLVITSPSNGARINVSVVDITGSTQPSADITIVLNGADQQAILITADALGAFHASVTLSYGTNSVRVTARSPGNEMTLDLKVSYQGPRLYILEPPDGTVVEAESIEVKGLAYDSNSDVNTQIYARLDGGPWSYIGTGGEYAMKFNFTRADNGNHTITLRAEDGSGTIYERVSIDVEIPEKVYALSAMASPKTREGRPGTGLTFKVSVKNTGTAEDLVSACAIFEGKWPVVFAFDEEFSSPLTFPYNFSVRANGERTFWVKMVVPSSAGNDESFKMRIEARSISSDASTSVELKGVAKLDIVGTAVQYLIWAGLAAVAAVFVYFAYKSYCKTKKELENMPDEGYYARYRTYGSGNQANDYGNNFGMRQDNVEFPSYGKYEPLKGFATYEDDTKGKFQSPPKY